MPTLSQQDLNFFVKNGYVIAPQVISRDQAERTARAVWDFAGMDPDDPESWYSDPPRGIMVEIYHHQTQWDNRTAPRVYEAFSQIWKTDRLWVSHDRASINPPSRDPDAPENNLHWDLSLENRPVSFGVQGVLYLTDTPAEQGAFVCVPGFHRRIEEWLDALPAEADPKGQDLLTLGPRRVGARAGDLVIWHSALPHTAALNRGSGVRVAQYITMRPAGDDQSEEARQRLITFWRDRLSGLGRYDKEREHHESPSAELTPLGRKIAGVDPW
jgi:hypothetical protein